MKVIVTGSNGFVGSVLMPYLTAQDIHVEGVERKARGASFPVHVAPDFLTADWAKVLEGVDIVVHLAARAHQMDDQNNAVTDQLYFAANCDVTTALADAAEQAGVKHFIFISSIAAMPFDPKIPEDKEVQQRWGAYGLSKWMAEEELLKRAQSPMRISILRPPLIYGPGVKGNMATLMKLANTSYPLPFGCLNDKKSFLYVGNLADAIDQLIKNPPAQNDTYVIKDCDLGLADIIAELRACKNRRPLLIPFPSLFFKILFSIMGKRKLISKLFGEQLVFDTKFSKIMKWQQPFTYKKGFQKMVDSCTFLTSI